MDINVFFPSIISVIVVIIGGYITFTLTMSIERQRNQYELKKAVFFDLIKSIITARRLMRHLHHTDQICEQVKKLTQFPNDPEILAEIEKIDPQLFERLRLSTDDVQILAETADKDPQFLTKMNKRTGELENATKILDEENQKLKTDTEEFVGIL